MINQSYENLTKTQIHKWCVSKITPCPFTIRDTTYMDGSANLRDSNAGLTAIGSLNEDWLAQWAETKHCFFFAKKVAIFRFYTFCEKSCWWCRDSFSSENEKLHFLESEASQKAVWECEIPFTTVYKTTMYLFQGYLHVYVLQHNCCTQSTWTHEWCLVLFVLKTHVARLYKMLIVVGHLIQNVNE